MTAAGKGGKRDVPEVTFLIAEAEPVVGAEVLFLGVVASPVVVARRMTLVVQLPSKPTVGEMCVVVVGTGFAEAFAERS